MGKAEIVANHHIFNNWSPGCLIISCLRKVEVHEASSNRDRSAATLGGLVVLVSSEWSSMMEAD